MVFSYSQIAAPSADTPKVISIAGPSAAYSTKPLAQAQDEPTPPPPAASAPPPAPPASIATSSNAKAGPSQSNIQHLILDAGPLLSLTPLRHLATEYHTTPAVLAELRDPKAREYWDRLGLRGVDVKVEHPTGEAMSRVMAFARKTGDYAVLSQTDLGVIALTLQYEVKVNGEANIRTEPGQKKIPSTAGPAAQFTAAETATATETTESASVARQGSDEASPAGDLSEQVEEDEDESDGEEIEDDTSGTAEGASEETEATSLQESSAPEPEQTDSNDPTVTSESATDTLSDKVATISLTSSNSLPATSAPAAPAEDEEDDPQSDGEWITPSNLSNHRSKDLGLLPSVSPNAARAVLAAACMTGDFAVQNVLLGMGLGLVGEGGKRIAKVKSWVLRCHACFKICRDPTRKFCPTCGGPTLMRTNITTTANGKTHLHLKANYQYNLRGTKYTIPDAKPGRSKGQIKGGTGLILREDQREWQDAVRMEEGRKRKEERKKTWDDPDWLPEIITVGMSGKGRSGGSNMPSIGHGRKNPNVARRKH